MWRGTDLERATERAKNAREDAERAIELAKQAKRDAEKARLADSARTGHGPRRGGKCVGY